MNTHLPACPALPTTEWMQEPVLVPETADQLDAALRYLLATRGDRAIGFDTETTGKDADATARLVQFATVETAVVIRLERLEGAVEVIKPWLAAAFADDVRFTAHNLRFDAAVLHRLGAIDAYAMARMSDDTLTLARVLEGARSDGDAESGKSKTSKDALTRISERNAGVDLPKSVHGLKVLCDDWLAESLSSRAQLDLQDIWTARGWTATPTKAQQHRSGWQNVSADSIAYLRYAGADALDTARLHTHLYGTARGALSEAVVTRERRIYAWAVARQIDGFRVDVEALATDADLEASAARLAELDEELAQLGVQPTRAVSVADSVERELRGGSLAEGLDDNPYRPTKRNKLGDTKDSLAADVLKPFASRSNIARLLLERAPLAKSGSSYGAQWLRRVDGDRMYPVIDPHGSTTGRMTMGAPSLLNVPANRRRFIIPRDGYTLLAGDLKAIEVRVGGALSRDAALIADLQAGRDPYGVVAELVFGAGYTKAERNAVKPVLLGRMYGRRPESVAYERCVEDPTRDYESEIQLAYRIMGGIDSRWSQLHLAGARLKGMVSSGLTRITLPSGRSIPVDPAHAKDGLSGLVQGAARDLLVDAGLRLLDMGYRPNNLLLAIHDEWVMEVPIEQAEQAARDLATVLTTTFLGVPIECEVGIIGAHWAKL